jgi:ABC-2 type transport system ATP-binding protein
MDQQGNGSLLELESVSKSFKEPLRNPFRKRAAKRALEAVDLSIPRGQVTCLLGPNGAGKTTLLKILASLITPDSGSIRFDGVPREEWDRATQGRIGLVTPNERSFYWRLTGRQNLVFFGSLHSLTGRELKDRVAEAIVDSGIGNDADKPYRLYSSGMKQKLNIARALLGHPELYLLDEPATHLDPLAREDFWDFVTGNLIRKRGATVLLCTHDLEEARRVADYLIILDKGRVVEQGKPADLASMAQGQAGLEIVYRGEIPPSWLIERASKVTRRGPGCLHLSLGSDGSGQEEAIRSFVEGGGALLEARASRIDLLDLLNKRLRPDA